MAPPPCPWSYWQPATVPIEYPVRNDLVINVQVSFTILDPISLALWSHHAAALRGP